MDKRWCNKALGRKSTAFAAMCLPSSDERVNRNDDPSFRTNHDSAYRSREIVKIIPFVLAIASYKFVWRCLIYLICIQGPTYSKSSKYETKI